MRRASRRPRRRGELRSSYADSGDARLPPSHCVRHWAIDAETSHTSVVIPHSHLLRRRRSPTRRRGCQSRRGGARRTPVIHTHLSGFRARAYFDSCHDRPENARPTRRTYSASAINGMSRSAALVALVEGLRGGGSRGSGRRRGRPRDRDKERGGKKAFTARLGRALEGRTYN